jgi:hypothetical protein
MKFAENWEIPNMRIYPELYDDIKKLYEKFGQSEVDQEIAAQLWGHKSAKSSQFSFSKLGSLREYGLIEGRGKIRVSDLGKKLTYPQNDEELSEAIVLTISRIPLWKLFFDTFTAKGKDIPTDTLWMDLRQIIGEDKLPPEKAKIVADFVRKAYLEDIKYYKPVKKEIVGGQGMEGEQINKSMGTSSSTMSQGDIVKGLFMYGAYDIAKQFIDFIANKSKEEKTNSTP